MADSGDNGGGKSCNLFGKETVNYPVTFDLKAIIESSVGEEESKKSMEKLFTKHKVNYKDWRTKPSSKGKYISYTISVEIQKQEILEDLYADMKKLPGLKFAM